MRIIGDIPNSKIKEAIASLEISEGEKNLLIDGFINGMKQADLIDKYFCEIRASSAQKKQRLYKIESLLYETLYKPHN